MKNKVVKMSIASAILCLAALSPVYASQFQPDTSGRIISEAKLLTTTWEESEDKEVVEMLYSSWYRGIDRLSNTKAATFSKDDFKLYFGFDIQRLYSHKLSNNEHQSFHMALKKAQESYQKGDKAYGILISSDERSAKIIWERNTGATHVGELVKYTDEKLGPLWKLMNEFDITE
ncbi:hypothetical protein [Paenibacillus ginsengarvi]|uniref:Uncharacterized protein n=1 Tax=Paenibacillus ginsengarvi TaxID=400777 RepID=A0A3B0AHF8_9BACL|nr:hypothetical protein [Paenibacillus ginsengarvi]RKN59992.1 hypothetical protein D7M11_36035 [Paenibacillus ginsengarvi]